jgi:nitrite reductase/ring-hydroxylating ferredoxin subunit
MSGDTNNWIATVAADTIDPEFPVRAMIGDDVEVALCRVEDEVFAVGNICTHAFARLSDGFQEGSEVFCPLHQGSFDVRTGAAIAAPCHEPIASYPTRIENGIVLVCPVARPLTG